MMLSGNILKIIIMKLLGVTNMNKFIERYRKRLRAYWSRYWLNRKYPQRRFQIRRVAGAVRTHWDVYEITEHRRAE